VPFGNTALFMVMGKFKRTIVVRLTESQIRFLTDFLVTEERNKSQVIRDALNQYLIEGSHKQRVKP
jgi:metal-responsive CopG/Arc/MetJ family transcriptional regulator